MDFRTVLDTGLKWEPSLVHTAWQRAIETIQLRASASLPGEPANAVCSDSAAASSPGLSESGGITRVHDMEITSG